MLKTKKMNQMNRNVIVFGATGKTGIQICRELESNGISYSVFVREQSLNKMENSSGKIKVGDVLNAGEVSDAFQNESYSDVVIALGNKELKVSKIRSVGTKHIMEALKKNQSDAHVHVVSALGIGDSWNQLKWYARLISNLLIKNAMNDHREQEKFVLNSTVTHHIVRPVGLRDGEAKGEVHVQNEGFLPSESIQRADVAKYLVKSLLENKTGVSGICQKK